jgi:LPXTG-motif cell wall-anchored protein
MFNGAIKSQCSTDQKHSLKYGRAISIALITILIFTAISGVFVNAEANDGLFITLEGIEGAHTKCTLDFDASTSGTPNLSAIFIEGTFDANGVLISEDLLKNIQSQLQAINITSGQHTYNVTMKESDALQMSAGEYVVNLEFKNENLHTVSVMKFKDDNGDSTFAMVNFTNDTSNNTFRFKNVYPEPVPSNPALHISIGGDNAPQNASTKCKVMFKTTSKDPLEYPELERFTFNIEGAFDDSGILVSEDLFPQILDIFSLSKPTGTFPYTILLSESDATKHTSEAKYVIELKLEEGRISIEYLLKANDDYAKAVDSTLMIDYSANPTANSLRFNNEYKLPEGESEKPALHVSIGGHNASQNASTKCKVMFKTTSKDPLEYPELERFTFNIEGTFDDSGILVSEDLFPQILDIFSLSKPTGTFPYTILLSESDATKHTSEAKYVIELKLEEGRISIEYLLKANDDYAKAVDSTLKIDCSADPLANNLRFNNDYNLPETYPNPNPTTDDSVSITFQPNGGSWADSSTAPIIVDCKIGDEITIPDGPVKVGAKFLYWEGSKYYPGDKYVVVGDHVFTAIYDEFPEVDTYLLFGLTQGMSETKPTETTFTSQPSNSAPGPAPSKPIVPENLPKTGEQAAYTPVSVIAAVSGVGLLLTLRKKLTK